MVEVSPISTAEGVMHCHEFEIVLKDAHLVLNLLEKMELTVACQLTTTFSRRIRTVVVCHAPFA